MYFFCILTLYLIEAHFNTFANRVDPDHTALTYPDQTALVRAASLGFNLLVYGNMIRYDPTLVDLTSYFLFNIQT